MKNLLLTILAFSNIALAKESDKSELIKKQIVEIAQENMTDESKQVEVRKKLDVLIADLIKINPEVDEDTWLAYAPGSWQQIWSDEADMSPPNSPKRDLSQVYQYISKDGWGFNFGVRKIDDKKSITYALQVRGTVQGNQQTTSIERALQRESGLQVGESIEDLAMQIWFNQDSQFIEREAGRFPKGPIGATGVLTILFLDQDLKIGTTPNVYNGVVELFVMQRSNYVVWNSKSDNSKQQLNRR